MKGFATLAEQGFEQAIVEHVCKLLSVYLSATGDEPYEARMRRGLEQARSRYEQAKKLMEQIE